MNIGVERFDFMFKQSLTTKEPGLGGQAIYDTVGWSQLRRSKRAIGVEEPPGQRVGGEELTVAEGSRQGKW